MSGDHALVLEGEPVAGTPESGLRLVEDEQHAAGATVLGKRGEISLRGLDDPAGAQDGLGDHGGKAAGGLPVDAFEPQSSSARQSYSPLDANGDR